MGLTVRLRLDVLLSHWALNNPSAGLNILSDMLLQLYLRDDHWPWLTHAQESLHIWPFIDQCAILLLVSTVFFYLLDFNITACPLHATRHYIRDITLELGVIKLLTALVCVKLYPIFNLQCHDHVNSYMDIGMGMFTYPIEIP